MEPDVRPAGAATDPHGVAIGWRWVPYPVCHGCTTGPCGIALLAVLGRCRGDGTRKTGDIITAVAVVNCDFISTLML